MRIVSLRRSGFTLTEVIIVSIIVAILAIVTIPMFRGFLVDATYKAAESTCEMVAAAITHAHNRGMSWTTSSDWAAIGIADPSDNNWTYTFAPLNARDSISSSYRITITGNGKTGYFYIRPPRWELPQ